MVQINKLSKYFPFTPDGRFCSIDLLKMVEPLLSGIVLGMVLVSAFGLFVAAFLQYRRGNQFEI